MLGLSDVLVFLCYYYLQAGMGLTTSCVKYCCSSSWKTELGGRPRRLAAAALAPLRAGLLPLLPLLRLRVGLAGVWAGLARGRGAGRSCGGAGERSPVPSAAEAGAGAGERAGSAGAGSAGAGSAGAGGSVGGTSCGVAVATGSAGATAGKRSSG